MRNARQQLLRRDQQRVMARAEALCNALGIVQFVAFARDRVADRIALDLPVVQGRQHGAQQAGIDASRQEQPEGHIGAHVLAHHLFKQRGKSLLRLRHVQSPGDQRLERPEALALHVQPIVDRQRMAGRHARDAGKGSALAAEKFVLQELNDGIGIQCRRCRQQWQQRLELRAEGHTRAVLEHIQRLDAQAVARQHQAPSRTVVQCQGEHSVQAPQAGDAFSRVDLQHAFRIRPGQRLDTVARAELMAQLDIVVDLAVDHRGEFMAGRDDRLVAAGQVDDRQPGVHQPDRPVQRDAEVIRAAVTQRRRSELELGAQRRRRG